MIDRAESERNRCGGGGLWPYGLLFLTGAAALSWQVLWQLDVSLALGVSAQAAAFTMVVVMGGLASGALLGGRWMERVKTKQPWRLLGLVEALAAGLAWLPRQVEVPNYGLLTLAMLPCCVLMGVTVPLIGRIARLYGRRLSGLYGANTLGAAFGSWLVALVLLPTLGRLEAAWVITMAQGVVAMVCFCMPVAKQPGGDEPGERETGCPGISPGWALSVCALTGAVTMILEVAWFRLLRAAWLSTSDSFALMLFCVLLGLSGGAFLAGRVRRVRETLALTLVMAGLAVWVGTPVIERLDAWSGAGGSPVSRHLWRTVVALGLIGPVVALLGMALPMLLDTARSSMEWGKRYAMNAFGAVMGGMSAGWYLLGYLGPVRTAWGAALLLVVVGLWMGRRQRGIGLWMGAGAVVAMASWVADSGIGRSRVQGPTALVRGAHRVVAHEDGPEVTTSVVEVPGGQRVLFIDGYGASAEAGRLSQYMHAMGKLPMRLHGSAEKALVICFGTGQTVRAVVDEGPKAVMVVDVNEAVFRLAPHFPSNRGVLEDPRVSHVVDDGRAWLRRGKGDYDVITLEPMPPFFAGSNSLYSTEFYELARARLSEGGCVAQWFPVHLLTPQQARSVAAAFVRVFPGAILWSDPDSLDRYGYRQQLVLLGRKGMVTRLEDANGVLDAEGLERYAAGIEPVTDDNQRLAFGWDGLQFQDLARRYVTAENWAELETYRLGR